MSSIATTNASNPALLPEYASLLDRFETARSVDAYAQLLPRDSLPGVINACAAAVAPMQNPKAAAVAVKILMAPYRLAQLQDAAAAAPLYAERADRYPEAVVKLAIGDIHDTLKFPPSIAEFVTALDTRKHPLVARLFIAEAMKLEHARREKEREREEHLARDREAYRARQAQGATS